MAVDLMPHPTERGVVFVATLEGRRLVVHERAADGSRAASYHPQARAGGEPLLLPARWLDGAGPLRWEKADARGGFCLLPCWTTYGASEAPAAGPAAEPDPRGPACACGDGLVAVSFNVHTKAFAFPCYSLGLFQRTVTACHVWNGQLHTGTGPAEGALFVAALRSCVERSVYNDDWSSRPPAPMYTTAPRRKK